MKGRLFFQKKNLNKLKGGNMVNLQRVEMTEEELADKKLNLEYCKIQKDETDINLYEMEKQLDAKIASRLMDDDIKKLKEDIKNKVTYDTFGNKVETTDADIDRMKIALEKLEKMKKLDIPTRQLRYNINKLRTAKERFDAPEKQIKKLEREIREKAYEIPAKRIPNGVE